MRSSIRSGFRLAVIGACLVFLAAFTEATTGPGWHPGDDVVFDAGGNDATAPPGDDFDLSAYGFDADVVAEVEAMYATTNADEYLDDDAARMSAGHDPPASFTRSKDGDFMFDARTKRWSTEHRPATPRVVRQE